MRSVFVEEVACCGGNMHGGVSGTRRMLGILSKNIQPIDRKSPANTVLGKKGVLWLGCGRRNAHCSGAARTVWAERLFLFSNILQAFACARPKQKTSKSNDFKASLFNLNWRRGRDLNPRYPQGVHKISSLAPSTTRPPLLKKWHLLCQIIL